MDPRQERGRRLAQDKRIKQVEGAIGYVELIYAEANKLPYALLKNSAGKFVAPTLASSTAAAAGAGLKAGTDFRVSITNAAGADVYPITSFTWLLVPADNKDPVKAKQIRDFLTWMISDEAQAMAQQLTYAPLPADVRKLVADRIRTLKAAGKPIPG